MEDFVCRLLNQHVQFPLSNISVSEMSLHRYVHFRHRRSLKIDMIRDLAQGRLPAERH